MTTTQKRNVFPGVIPDDGSAPYCNKCKATVDSFKYRPGLKVQDGWHASVLEYAGDDVLVIRCHGQKWVMRRDLHGQWCVDAVSTDVSAIGTEHAASDLPPRKHRRITNFMLRARHKLKTD